MIEADHLDDIAIERMIFHVVGPEAANLVLLEEIDPGDHAEFSWIVCGAPRAE